MVLAVVFFLPTLVFGLVDQWPYWSESLSRGQPIGRDAYNFWTAVRMCQEGHCSEIYDVPSFASAQKALLGPEVGFNCFLYPPSALILLYGLGKFPYIVALVIWSLLGAGAFVAAVAAPRFDRKMLLLCLLAPMTLFNLVGGQTGLVCAALLIGGLRLSASRPVLAGILIGLLSFKPILGVLVPLLLLGRRQWLCFVSASLTTVALVLLSSLAWGWEIWRAFLEQAMPLQRSVLERGIGIGVWMIPSTFNSARLLGMGLAGAYLAHAVVALLALALVVRYSWRTRHQGAISPADILLLTVSTCLVSPYIHNYDFSIVEGAIVGWVVSQAAQSRTATEASGLAVAGLWALGISSFALNAGALPLAPMIQLLALAALSVSLAEQNQAGTEERQGAGIGFENL